VAIGPVTVEAAANPLVPRDQVTSKTTIAGQQFSRLPVQDVRDVLRLEPGWSRAAKRRASRSAAAGPESGRVRDGALVRNSQRGESDLTLAPTRSRKHR